MAYSASIQVNLGQRSYEVKIGSGLLDRFGEVLAESLAPRRAALITNDEIWSLHGGRLGKSLDGSCIRYQKITVPDGESAKSLPIAEEVYGQLIEAGFERGEPIVAFGGGVVGDLAGFLAATYLRGVPLVHVPTTLLAQIDSSIGGKVAINHPRGKNLIGMFYQPTFVFSDVDVLRTLDLSQLRNGLAEAIKYGFIWENGPLDYIEEHLDAILDADAAVIAPLVRDCSAIKARIVEIDERDRGLRAILNYGHTFGHAIETSSHYAFSHGEAISIGMHFAARLSAKLGMVDESVVQRHDKLLTRAGLPTKASRVNIESVIRAMSVDKKRQGGENLFVLLEGIGRPVVRPVPDDVVIELIVELTGVVH
ncbi:MAG: 3-dehydroquinate synthase [Actinobacteria bacterium]|nr:3-dehydroquinate synthase [Chloroflexota bacterium]MCL5292304.1 3-dehydroquinate synthase [Actinomycetota bacterium]